MYKYKTHQNENNFKYSRSFTKTRSVRPSQTMSLSKIVEMASRGVAPKNINFSTISNDFIPPQYDRSHIVERFNRLKSLESQLEISQQKKLKEQQPPAVQQPPAEQQPNN